MIDCHIHDYVEIACMYRIDVELTLVSGDKVLGKPVTTGYDELKRECLYLDVSPHPAAALDSMKEPSRAAIVLDDVLTMKAIETNQHFNMIDFRQSA
ncbi:Rho-binding antiterminator [Aestuariibacter sp. AA17]|uniref:Rho-binding antiterminator n=1 Tax=Fluctibacter corallii TaxID=2984329 RepID=A0ABT3A5N0_9ALTE|nr:Rho-binding antiterminator [Aestuariibacter sp. AA17]MCV2883666.1 Rho-binding antiterminator [Aestuariibacter sp. AA17]